MINFKLFKVKIMKRIGRLLYFFNCRSVERHIEYLIDKQGIDISNSYEQRK
jgi:hypothetical protein